MEWIEQDILAILPTYRGDKGNCTLILREDGQHIIERTVKTVIKKICKHNHIDLRAANETYGGLLNLKTNIPLVISPERIFIQLKAREPVGKDDGAMGYFKLGGIDEVIEREGGAIIRLKNKTEIGCLCSADNARNQISKGNLAKELYGTVRTQSVQESLEYYHSKDGPAMKSDIARLYMKLDDLLIKLG